MTQPQQPETQPICLPVKGTNYWTILDVNNCTVAQVGNTRMDAGEIAEMRNFIIRAVNSHHDLLNAIKTYLEIYQNKDKEPGWIRRVEAAKFKLHAAITKAEMGDK